MSFWLAGMEGAFPETFNGGSVLSTFLSRTRRLPIPPLLRSLVKRTVLAGLRLFNRNVELANIDR